MKITPERTRLAAVALALALLAGAGAWAWRSVGQLNDAAAQAEQAQQVLTRLAGVLSALTDAESTRRGLALGGEPGFAEGHGLAREKLRAEMDLLRPLLARQPEQYVRLVALGPLLQRRLDNLALTVDPRSRNAPAQQAELTNEGRRLQERVRAAVAELMRHGADELARARQQADEAGGRSRAAVALVTALGLGLAGVGLVQWQRAQSVLRRQRAHREADNDAQRLEAETAQRLFEAPTLNLCVLDAEGRFVRIGAGCQRLWGWSAEQLQGTPFIDKVWHEDRRKTEQALSGAAAGKPVLALRHRWQRADGGLAHLSWGLQASGHDGQLLGVASDQTELQTLRQTTTKAAEALREGQAELEAGRKQVAVSSRWQASFLAALHQALSPTSLRLVEMAAQAQHGGVGPLDDVQRRHWAGLADQAKDLNEAVRDALDLGRIDAGTLELQRETFDLWESLIQVAAQARVLAERKGLDLQVDLADNLGYVRGDAQRVEQVLQRILRGAIDATAAGCLRLQARRPDESQVVVTVIDSRGETGRDLLQAFVANQSLPGGAAPPAGALGLALAQRLIQLMGGQLGVSQHTPAAKPAGWQFELVLPTDNLNVP
ncbi:MAG: CHASE3 domain-containing protein [Rubrivivax sp.]|nr:CHASE3 domain-containing protein [Rubrivivax sp.]